MTASPEPRYRSNVGIALFNRDGLVLPGIEPNGASCCLCLIRYAGRFCIAAGGKEVVAANHTSAGASSPMLRGHPAREGRDHQDRTNVAPASR